MMDIMPILVNDKAKNALGYTYIKEDIFICKDDQTKLWTAYDINSGLAIASNPTKKNCHLEAMLKMNEVEKIRNSASYIIAVREFEKKKKDLFDKGGI